jgi:hypothetical protein
VIPGEVLGLIEGTSSIKLSGVPTNGVECQGAKFHSPRPMVVHPFEMTSADSEDETVHLCGTCANNVQVLLALLKAYDGRISWTVRRCFGNLVRGVAEQAYVSFKKESTHA